MSRHMNNSYTQRHDPALKESSERHKHSWPSTKTKKAEALKKNAV